MQKLGPLQTETKVKYKEQIRNFWEVLWNSGFINKIIKPKATTM